MPLDPERPYRGWYLVNGTKYAALVHAANTAIRQARHRARQDQSVTERDDRDMSPKLPTIRSDPNRTDKEITRGAPRPRDLIEVKGYFEEKKLHGDPEQFFDHYEGNGWKQGRVPLRDWRAAARNWSRRDGDYGGSSSKAETPRGKDDEPAWMEGHLKDLARIKGTTVEEIKKSGGVK